MEQLRAEIISLREDMTRNAMLVSDDIADIKSQLGKMEAYLRRLTGFISNLEQVASASIGSDDISVAELILKTEGLEIEKVLKKVKAAEAKKQVG